MIFIRDNKNYKLKSFNKEEGNVTLSSKGEESTIDFTTFKSEFKKLVLRDKNGFEQV